MPYQPGQTGGQGYHNGKEVATDTVETTGAPARIVLSPARTTLQADGEDAVVVPVSILDAEGRVVPDADNRVYFHLTGEGRILGIGNGNPSDHDSDQGRSAKRLSRSLHGRRSGGFKSRRFFSSR